MINLELDESLFVPKALPYITDYSHRWEFWMGSAGSGKSYSICQKLIIRACGEKMRILVCRQFGSTLRNSCFSLFKEILARWKLTQYVKIKETDFSIKFPNGSEIIMIGLDDEQKLLSINNISTIWIEEAFQVSRSTIEQLDLRMRGKAKNQQLILSWNPISADSYLYDLSVQRPPANSILIHSTYKDNPFLSDAYVSTLEELYERNPQKARIYCDGEWGIDSDGLVFQNWDVKTFDVMELAKTCEHRAGMDIGWTDPTAILNSLYDKSTNTIYVFDEFYKTGQTLDEIYNAIMEMKLDKTTIYCDSAEPRTIDYLKSRRLNAKPSIKGKGSVRAQISFLQNHKIIVDPSCANLIRELSNFSYKKDKQTGKYTEETTHEYSHAINGLGYAYCDIYTKRGITILDKSALGL